MADVWGESWLATWGDSWAAAVPAVVKVDLSPVTLEGRAVLRETEGIFVTRVSHAGGVSRVLEGVW